MSVQVTEAEWKIMECLWDHAPQTSYYFAEEND